MDKKCSKTPIIIICFFLIIVFFLFGYFVGRTPVMSENVSKEQIQREFIDELRDVGILQQLPEELNYVDGRVFSIEEGFLTITPEKDRLFNPAGAYFPEKMGFVLTPETIYKVATAKTAEEYDKEVEEYNQKKEAGEEGLTYPDILNYELVPSTSLHIGDIVKVTVDGNIIQEEGPFVVKEVLVANETSSIME